MTSQVTARSRRRVYPLASGVHETRSGSASGHRWRAGRGGTDRDRRARRRGRRRRRLPPLSEPAGLDHGPGGAGRRLGHDRPRVPVRIARREARRRHARSSTWRAPAARSGSPSSSRRTAGDPYQLMMTGLVMLGAIETNKTDVGLDATTPIATLITETEAIVVPTKSKLPHAQGPHGRPRSATRRRSAGRADRRAAPTSCWWASSRSVLGADPAKTKYVAHSGGGEANAGDPLRLGRRRRDRALGGRRPGRGAARCACSRSPRP